MLLACRSALFFVRFALLLGFAAPLFGQDAQQQWLQRYNGPANGFDRANAIVADAAGNVIVTGTSALTAFNRDYYTVKYSPTGAVVWAVRYDGTGASIDEARAIAVDTDGNVLVTGESQGAQSRDVYTAKYAAATGALLWSRRYAGTTNRNKAGHAIAVGPTGNVAVAGAGGVFNEDFFVALYTSSGAVLWEKSFTGGGSIDGSERFSDVAFDAAGNVVVTGTGPGKTASSTFSEMVTIKYAPSGTLIWETRFNDNSTGEGHVATALAVDADGNVVITGYTGTPNNSDDYYTAKYTSASGALIWEARYNSGTGVSAYDRAEAITLDSAGDVIVTGRSAGAVYTEKYRGDTGARVWQQRSTAGRHGYSIKADLNNNVVVAGYDAIGSNTNYYTAEYRADDGGIVWEKTYDGGRTDYIEGRKQLALTSDGGVAVTGYSQNAVPNDDYVTIKYARTYPTVQTQAANKITGTSAQLHGIVRPNGLQSQAFFEYGTTVALGSSTPPVDAGAGTDPVPVSANLTDLASSTRYYFRVVALTEGGFRQPGTILFFDAVPDVTLPIVTVLGTNPLTLQAPATYVEAGATAEDSNFGPLSVTITGAVQGNVPGTYTLTYSATDGSGNTGTATRAVNIIDTIPPVVTRIGDAFVTIEAGTPYVDQGATAVDSSAGALTPAVTGSVNHLVPGDYVLTYTADDGHGNTASVTRTVRVVDTTPPVIAGLFFPVELSTGPEGFVLLPDYAIQAETTDIVGVASVTQTPVVGTPLLAGQFVVVTVRASDAANNAQTVEIHVRVLDGTPPSISAPAGGFAPLELVADINGFALAPDYAAQAVKTDNVGVVGTTQVPPAGALLPFGPNTIRLIARDGAGLEASLEFGVMVRLSLPVTTVVAMKGNPVPGAGVDPRIPADAMFASIGQPAISEAREVVFLASWKSSSGRGTGIFAGAVPQLLVKAGDDAPGIAGARFQVLSAPLIAPNGNVVFRATVTGPRLSAARKLGAWLHAEGSLQMLAQRGAQIPGAPDRFVLGSISSLSARNSDVLMTAQLAPRGNLITPASDTVLLRLTPQGATILAREGALVELDDGYPAAKIKSLSALLPAPGSGGHGRWHADGGAVAQVTLANQRKVVLHFAADGSIARSLAVADGVPNLPDTSVVADLGLPAIDPAGNSSVVMATMIAFQIPGLPDVVTKKNDKVLLHSADAGAPFVQFAQEGDVAPGSGGAVFSSFRDPIVNDSGMVAFVATLAGKGVTAENKTAIWHGAPDALQVLARSNRKATDESGNEIPARWLGFTSLALASSPAAGPVVVATLAGPGVTTRNNRGVWAADSRGKLRKLLRTGDMIDEKRVIGIQALTGVPGSLGASRGFNGRGAVVARVILSGGSHAVVRLDVPDGSTR